MTQLQTDSLKSVQMRMIDLLQGNLSDGIDLLQQTKHAHWNIRGDNFISLHLLFDQVYQHIESSVDSVAERIAQLGGIAEGLCSAVVKRTSLPVYPLHARHEQDHIRALVAGMRTFARSLRVATLKATEARDAVTADLCTEVLRSLDKDLWMVDAHSDGQTKVEMKEYKNSSLEGVA